MPGSRDDNRSHTGDRRGRRSGPEEGPFGPMSWAKIHRLMLLALMAVLMASAGGDAGAEPSREHSAPAPYRGSGSRYRSARTYAVISWELSSAEKRPNAR
jgi:hypothetical protein